MEKQWIDSTGGDECAVLSHGNLVHVWMVYVVVALMSLLTAIFEPAYEAALPSLVDQKEVPSLIGLMDFPSRMARVAGSGMAGILLTLMPVMGFFVIDSGTFVISAASLWLVFQWEGSQRHERQSRPNMWGDMKRAVDILRRDRVLAAVYGLDGLGNVLFAVFTLGSMVFSVRVLHAGAGGYGWLIAAYGLGGVVGNVVASQQVGMRWRVGFALSGWGAIGLTFLLLSFSHSLTPATLCVMFAGMFGAMAHVSRSTLIAARVVVHELGRVHALRNVLCTVSSAVGMVACGAYLVNHPISLTFLLAGAILLMAYVAVCVRVCKSCGLIA